MRFCVVGNGPSAKGHGTEIDACDFVVRMKAWWAHGAEDAGQRIDAWAWFGADQEIVLPVPVFACEHWFTHCMAQAPGWDTPMLRAAFAREARQQPTRFLADWLWIRAVGYLDRLPSTGFVAVLMGLEALCPAELLLIGFDSLTPGSPNFNNARYKSPRNGAHNFVKEKAALAEIHNGSWLGKPINTKLEWIGGAI